MYAGTAGRIAQSHISLVSSLHSCPSVCHFVILINARHNFSAASIGYENVLKYDAPFRRLPLAGSCPAVLVYMS